MPSLSQRLSDVGAVGGRLCMSPGHKVAVVPTRRQKQGAGSGLSPVIRKRKNLPQKSLSGFTFPPLGQDCLTWPSMATREVGKAVFSHHFKNAFGDDVWIVT